MPFIRREERLSHWRHRNRYTSTSYQVCVSLHSFNGTGDINGVEPIHEAAAANRLETLQFLLKKGAKLTAPDKKGQMPVHKVK